MSCEHGLTIKECYVCMSPKYGEKKNNMSIGISNENEVLPLQVVLGSNEVLRVTPDGQFIWNPDADRMIEEGDYSASPAMPHILRALRKREWVGLTTTDWNAIAYTREFRAGAEWAERLMREKNGG